MSIVEIKIQFNSTSNPITPEGWIDGGEGNVVGVKATDMDGSGIGYEVTTAFNSASVVAGSFESGVSHHGIPYEVWGRVSSATTSSGGSDAKFFGGVPGLPVEIDFFGCSTNAGRHRLLTVDGVTYQNDQPADVSTPLQPLAPTTAYATFDENGEILMHFAAVSINASFAGLILRYDDEWSPGAQITAFNESEFAGRYGQVCSLAVSGFSNSLTGATIAGIECAGLSDISVTLPSLVDETVVPMVGGRDFTVTDGVDSDTKTVTVFAPTGFNSVILGDDLNQTNTGTIFDFVPAAKEGDAIFSESTLVVDNKGNIIDAPAGIYNCWHLSVDGVDPNIAVARSFVVTLGGEQPTPDSFTFNTQTNVELSTFVESNTIYISGLGEGVDANVSVSNCKYSINGGAFASTPTTIKNGDSLKLEIESSGSYSTSVVGSITVGTYSTTFTVTTKSPPVPTTTVDLTTMTAQINATGTGDITYEIETQAQYGVATVSNTGLIEYTAGETFVGRDSFVIKVTDDVGSTYIRVSVTGRGSGGAFSFGIGIGIGINII